MIYEERLKALRERIGLTQVAMANLLGVSKVCYHQYEIEKDIMPLKHLITICNYFDVSLDYIFNYSATKQYKVLNKEVNLEYVGKRLKEFRKNQNLTQEKLASKLCIAKSMVSSYERGEFLVSTHTLYDICRMYKLSADYLLGRVDSPQYLK